METTPSPTPRTPSAPPAAARPPATMPMPNVNATATLRDAAGMSIGTATFRDTRAGVLISGTVTGLGLGAHGIHVHAVGKCEAPFTTAGGHFNPESKHHGYLSADGPHLGDLPNIETPASGPLKFEFVLADVSLKGKNALLDADGASLVVHSGRDDFMTDPAGNSGSRMACGVILAR
ncbi:MAG TPA: superoxide dismutase family protein [Gemmatimonadaceae bacterium]|nr:superoxide dismutase family protein [Gemmatimonadaceae bacterium]